MELKSNRLYCDISSSILPPFQIVETNSLTIKQNTLNIFFFLVPGLIKTW